MNATERLFQRLNQQYFDGRLPEYQIVLREDLNSGCGECDKKKREIHLDAKLAGDELTKILLHEMAHAAVPRKGHGKAWLAEMKRLADMGAPTREDWETYQDPKRTKTDRKRAKAELDAILNEFQRRTSHLWMPSGNRP